ncbi:DNA polymerase III subunit beta, partial [Planctomycetota bacterium]
VVGSVVQQRPTRPILSTVLLVAKDGKLEIHATDLEIGIRLDVPGVEIEEEGQIAISQARVASILRETADERISLATDNQHCIITASDSEFRLPTESAEEFPEIPVFDEGHAYDLDRVAFVDMVSKTCFAAHRGKHRYALNGVLLEIKPKSIIMVATDGRRLAYIEKKGKFGDEADESVIVPTKALDQVIKVLTDDDEMIHLNILENQIVAKTARAAVSTRLVEGHFPPYDSVIPKDCDKKVDIAREQLHSAVRRAALLTSEDSSAVYLSFGGGKVVVTAAAPETGEAKVELEIDYSGPEVELGFNPEFLTDLFRALDDETIRIEFRDASSAGMFRAGKEFQYVVMPVSRE